ncbi:MAG: DUF3086 domain-containing protein [Cyanobacteria bacterium SID2]|nr:DUF3086 domain-containing protein [Cyanobacteria bacterium SID2]
MNPEENPTPESQENAEFQDAQVQPHDRAIELDSDGVEETPEAVEIDLAPTTLEASVEPESIEPEAEMMEASVEPESIEPEADAIENIVDVESMEASIEPQPWDEKTPEEASEGAEPVETAEPESAAISNEISETTEREVNALDRRAAELREEIATLEATKAELLRDRSQMQADMGRLIQEGLSELEKRKQHLTVSIEKLERRQERIRKEMRTTFAGVSQDLAVRLQGFKEYLVGSLQELAAVAEQLELAPPPPSTPAPAPTPSRRSAEPETAPTPQFSERAFQEQRRLIRRLLEQYRNAPDYYGPPWQLRRTFEPVHAERVANWFFSQGGRGALKSTNSRLQNILIASAIISVLHAIYGKRLRTLVLANAPERLGEWRRGLQDCLGIARPDFGPDRGVALFEAPEPLAQRADRLAQSGLMPLVIVDESESQLNLALLQFPLWLAFAPDPESAFVREW